MVNSFLWDCWHRVNYFLCELLSKSKFFHLSVVLMQKEFTSHGGKFCSREVAYLVKMVRKPWRCIHKYSQRSISRTLISQSIFLYQII